MGWDGLVWDGMEWDGMGLDRMGWVGVERSLDGVDLGETICSVVRSEVNGLGCDRTSREHRNRVDSIV